MADLKTPPAKPPPAPVLFVLLMPWGRVGSHLIASALDGTRGIHVENEPTTGIRTHGHRDGLSLPEIRDRQFRHLEAFTRSHPPGRIAVGLKLSHRSLVDQTGYLQRLSAHRARLVLMVRRNSLKCAVSQLRALTRAQVGQEKASWASPWAVMADEPKPGPAAIDAAEAVRLADVFATMHDRMLANVRAVFGTDWKCVEYEDLSADPDRVVREVFGYLQLPAPRAIPIRHRKATSDCLRDDVVNFEELEAAAIEAGLGGFL